MVIEWGTVLYGAALTALFVPIALRFGLGEREGIVLISSALAAGLAAIGWNAVLIDAGAGGFFVDAPIAVFPASWQDTGTGVWAFAATAAVCGVIATPGRSAAQATRLAAVAGLVAFLVDIYLY